MTSPALFRADHVGSLLRPRALKAAFRAHADGKLDDAGFRAAQDAAIKDAVRLQEEVGLHAITDGEFRRTAWSAGFVWALDGLEPRPSLFEFTDAAGDVVRWETCYAERRVRRTRGITTDEFEFVQRHTRGTPKVTMPAPSFLHFFRGPEWANRAIYADLDAFLDDLVGIYRAELADLARLGCRYVQLDEVPVAMLGDDSVRERVRTRGEDPDALLRRYVGAVNRIVEARPAGMTIAMHLCRGNLRGHWMASGGYDAVAEALFGGANVDAFLLEYDTPRAGDFSPLRFLSAEKRAILGLVSSKTPALETLDGLRQRLDEAAKVVPLERLGITPQCGFASTVGGNPLTEDDQRAKLARVVETAEKVWGTA
jgi:5-methyltetrahydropteroyltriglutamate--homocysteine methyltransferase